MWNEMERYTAISRTVMADPGGRGLAGHTTALPLLNLIARDLTKARGVLLLSGFPVQTDTGVFGETDGPSGVAWLAHALQALKVPVWLYTSRQCLPQMSAAMELAAPGVPVCALPYRGGREAARRIFNETGADQLVCLEYPARAQDGDFYNCRGQSIAPFTADGDPLLTEATARGYITIAVGDGGNELGMGSCRKIVEKYVKYGSVLCAAQSARYTLVGGVSNWWGWGLAAALSLWNHQMLLPDDEQEQQLLKAVLASGGADGATHKREMTVDEMPLQEHLKVLQQLRRIVTED